MSSCAISKRHVTVRQAAALLCCCQRTIYRRIHDGSLPNTRRLRGGYLIPLSDLEALAVPLTSGEPHP
jgi:excisionase family DNA binding protein